MAKPFQPTLKEKKRYVVCEFVEEATTRDVSGYLFGMHGLAHMGLQTLENDAHHSILRVTHTHTDHILAALAWMGVKSIFVSGSLKQARSKLYAVSVQKK